MQIEILQGPTEGSFRLASEHGSPELFIRNHGSSFRGEDRVLDQVPQFPGGHEYDFVVPGVLMVQGDRELQRVLLTSYGYRDVHLDEVLRARLMLLTILYECSIAKVCYTAEA